MREYRKNMEDKEQLMASLFDILAGQGLLTEEENTALKLELENIIEKRRGVNVKSRNI